MKNHNNKMIFEIFGKHISCLCKLQLQNGTRDLQDPSSQPFQGWKECKCAV